MYTLTPETLIRIEDASDPERGFIMKPWSEVFDTIVEIHGPFVAQQCLINLETGFTQRYDMFKLIHTDAITEVE